MTALSISRIQYLNVVATFWAWYKKISNYMSNVRKFRKTVSELNKLSPHILEDIGMSKSNINSVAYHHIYGKMKR